MHFVGTMCGYLEGFFVVRLASSQSVIGIRRQKSFFLFHFLILVPHFGFFTAIWMAGGSGLCLGVSVVCSIGTPAVRDRKIFCRCCSQRERVR